jgi:hypothetical protein
MVQLSDFAEPYIPSEKLLHYLILIRQVGIKLHSSRVSALQLKNGVCWRRHCANMHSHTKSPTYSRGMRVWCTSLRGRYCARMADLRWSAQYGLSIWIVSSPVL